MSAKTLMVQGTMSSAGKSLLVTGLCRMYARQGLRVAPYKSQNMSNNAGVCTDGSEIGRAQFTQALACGLAPAVEMNPILIKPEADAHSQVILMGKPYASLPAREYYQHIDHFWQQATRALDDLRDGYDLVIIEGAGSPAEINLRQGDIVNMAVADYARAPVMLAGDIDRGGIFAQLLGTLWLLEPEELALVKGLIVNKFRGDISLFYDGVQTLEEKGGVPVVGVVPYLHHTIPEEDAVAIEAQNFRAALAEIDLAVVRLPRISNFDDFDPLAAEQGVSVRYIDSPAEINAAAAVILPGTKSTIADLNWMIDQGLFAAIQEFALAGGAVVGICGGYQMLGRLIHDSDRFESDQEVMVGLSLLPTETFFRSVKDTHQAEGRVVDNAESWMGGLSGETLTGYEIHMGETHLIDAQPWLEITHRTGGMVSVGDGVAGYDGRVWGCYLHGLFENPGFRRAWLRSLGWQPSDAGAAVSLQQSFDQLADHLETHLDLDLINEIIGL